MDRHFLLQGVFPTEGSNPGLLHRRQILYCLSHRGSPESAVHMSPLFWISFPFRSTQHWVEFPVLYSRFSLVVHFIPSINSIYMSIPIGSPFITPASMILLIPQLNHVTPLFRILPLLLTNETSSPNLQVFLQHLPLGSLYLHSIPSRSFHIHSTWTMCMLPPQGLCTCYLLCLECSVHILALPTLLLH